MLHTQFFALTQITIVIIHCILLVATIFKANYMILFSNYWILLLISCKDNCWKEELNLNWLSSRRLKGWKKDKTISHSSWPVWIGCAMLLGYCRLVVWSYYRYVNGMVWSFLELGRRGTKRTVFHCIQFDKCKGQTYYWKACKITSQDCASWSS